MVIKLRGRKDWIVNKTNARSLAKMFGDDVDNWIGKTPTLWPKPDVEFNGEVKPAIRVLVKAAAKSVKPVKPPVDVDLNDAIPDFGDEPPADEDGNPL